MSPTLPLRHKLPLLISALLCVVVAALSWLGYDRLQRVLLVASAERLENGATQFSGMLHEQLLRIRRETRRLAEDPAVLRYLDGTSTLARGRADSVLAIGVGATPQLVERTLWSRGGVLLLRVGPDTKTLARETDAPPPSPVPYDPAQVRSASGFRERDGRAYYDIVVPAATPHGDTLGFVVETRTVTAGSARNMGKLVGPDARLLLGNSSGDLWTDLVRVVRPSDTVDGPRARVPDGAIRVTDHVPETPWAVAISMPRRSATLPARQFLVRAWLLALVIIVAGALGAFLLSRSITGPLDEVSRAAEGIAAGDYTRRAAVKQQGEFGQLARSFNVMADQVAHATTELAAHAAEARASARDLESTNAELQRALEAFRLAREASEAASREREETIALLNVVLASAPVGFALLDADLCFVRVNETMARLTGAPLEAHPGRHVAELQPDVWTRVSDLLRVVLRERKTLVDIELVRPAAGGVGRERHFRASLFPVSTDDAAAPCVGVFLVETTQQKMLEAQLLQAQRMEAVGHLAGGIAHDFNNLLTVITNYGGMLLADLPHDSAAHADAREMIDAANRAAGLTRQLLAFSRRQVLQPQVLDVSLLAANLEKMLRRLLPEDIHLETCFDAAPHLVFADPGQLEQVLMNLVVNARDAMPKGGRIAIGVRRIEMTASERGDTIPPGGYVALTVADSGNGMDAATLERIFDPFFTTKPVGKGTGLGLSTAYGIVQQSGGHIRVESEVGRGSTFTVYLPAVAAAVQTPSAPRAAIGSNGRRHEILLVEDESSVRVIARRILEAAGYAVVEASNGVEAMRLIEGRSNAFALVLTDLVMPEMGGRELADRLRALHPAPRVLFMSGYTEDVIMRQGADERGGLFLQKPFTTDSLRRKVSEALS